MITMAGADNVPCGIDAWSCFRAVATLVPVYMLHVHITRNLISNDVTSVLMEYTRDGKITRIS